MDLPGVLTHPSEQWKKDTLEKTFFFFPEKPVSYIFSHAGIRVYLVYSTNPFEIKETPMLAEKIKLSQQK